jgi:TonB family protein
VTVPRKLKDAAPVYPEIALAAGIQGSVLIELQIDATGKVASARVVKGVPALDDAALAAANAWVYEPARLRGKAVLAVLTERVDFTLPMAGGDQ